MNPEVQEQWAEALESGHFKQTQGRLTRVDPETGEVEGYCCLGVLCELAFEAGAVTREVNDGLIAYGEEREGGVLPVEVQKWAGLTVPNPRVNRHFLSQPVTLAECNDRYGDNFQRIAELVRKL